MLVDEVIRAYIDDDEPDSRIRLLQNFDLFCRSGGDVNSRSLCGDTLLHLAVDDDLPDAVAFLLEKGARPDLTNGEGWPVLPYTVELEIDGAAQAGTELDFRLTRLLLEAGADLSMLSPDGESSLTIARQYGKKAERILLSLVADIMEDTGLRKGHPDDEVE